MKCRVYILYGGESEDGRGPGRYIGRTTDKEKARKHFLKTEKNPYSTGCVIVQTGKTETIVLKEDDL